MNILKNLLNGSLWFIIGYGSATIVFDKETFKKELEYTNKIHNIEMKSTISSNKIDEYKVTNDIMIEQLQTENRNIKDNLNSCNLSMNRLNSILKAKNQQLEYSDSDISNRTCADLIEYSINVTSKYNYCKMIHDETKQYFNNNGIFESSYK